MGPPRSQAHDRAIGLLVRGAALLAGNRASRTHEAASRWRFAAYVFRTCLSRPLAVPIQGAGDAGARATSCSSRCVKECGRGAGTPQPSARWTTPTTQRSPTSASILCDGVALARGGRMVVPSSRSRISVPVRRGAAPRPAGRAVCSGAVNDASAIAASLAPISTPRPLRGSTRPRRRVRARGGCRRRGRPRPGGRRRPGTRAVLLPRADDPTGPGGDPAARPKHRRRPLRAGAERRCPVTSARRRPRSRTAAPSAPAFTATRAAARGSVSNGQEPSPMIDVRALPRGASSARCRRRRDRWRARRGRWPPTDPGHRLSDVFLVPLLSRPLSGGGAYSLCSGS
ncbi:uncharacterized protein SOCE836_033980 [Sorangium cellulosum]|uniref:Uncharacterized protein n=1 Tax=Sorangium cellulosum TaxID=56 RepID=A0A4P2QMG9_SORCE|nr:uncharacterized protein SOCE836_033980 [Sorangium cellulosum]WCQ90653.1 hypothetical protein NQZ70_03364 [Sorangium sp. Soce836]